MRGEEGTGINKSFIQKKMNDDRVFNYEECVVCTNSAPTHILRPCAHACLCKNCVLNVLRLKSVCPLCRVKVVSVESMEKEEYPTSGKPHDIATFLVRFKFMEQGVDAENIEQVIVEAMRFLEPLSELEFALSLINDTFYNLAIQGFENQIDIVEWAKAFLGANRRPQLECVTHTYVNTYNGKMVVVIQINKHGAF